MLKIRVNEYGQVRNLIADILDYEGVLDVIETPIKMGIDGDFYPTTFANATHLLRIALNSGGYEVINHTHDIAWCDSNYGDDPYVGEGMAEDGWLMLSTHRPAHSGDWVLFVPYTPEDNKLFWATAPNDPYTMWMSKAVELKPYKLDIPNLSVEVSE